MKQLKGRNNLEPYTPLKNIIFDVLRSGKQFRVRDVYERLRKRRDVALTSVAVALDRLFVEGFVGRKIEAGKGGLHYIYFPRKTRKQFEKSVAVKRANNFSGLAVLQNEY